MPAPERGGMEGGREGGREGGKNTIMDHLEYWQAKLKVHFPTQNKAYLSTYLSRWTNYGVIPALLTKKPGDDGDWDLGRRYWHE